MAEISPIPARTRSRSSLVVTSGPAGAPAVTLADIQAFQKESSSVNTRRGYATHWKAFSAWCEQRGYTPLPADPVTVGAYLTYAANLPRRDPVTGADTGKWFYSSGTLAHWLGSINAAHDMAGFPRPGTNVEVKRTLAGIKRTRLRPSGKKAPLMLTELRRALAPIDLTSWPAGIIGHRDSALLLIGFAGAYRRSELADLQVGDVRVHSEDGLHLFLQRSKTDQEGEGSTKAIPYGANPLTCPPCAFVRWVRVLAAAETGRVDVLRVLAGASTAGHVCREALPAVELGGHLFRPVLKNGAIQPRGITGNVVNDVVKRRVGVVGLNRALYGAHSLRAGFVTQAFRAGATHHEVMRQTGHTDAATVERYARDNAPLANNAVTRLDL